MIKSLYNKPYNYPAKSNRRNKMKRINWTKIFNKKLLPFCLVFSILHLFCAVSCFAADFAGTLSSVSITDTSGTNIPPTASFTYTFNDNNVTLDASDSVDPDGTITEFKWDFSDGTSSIGETVVHQMSTESVDVTLVLIDNQGAITLKQENIITAQTTCFGAPDGSQDCTITQTPLVFSKDSDRTTVNQFIADKNATANRIKIYFGTPSVGTWNDCNQIKAIMYNGSTIVATADITPQNNAWIWSEALTPEPGQVLSFEQGQKISFGVSIDITEGINVTYFLGYYTITNSTAYLYKNLFLPIGESWGTHNYETFAAILEVNI